MFPAYDCPNNPQRSHPVKRPTRASTMLALALLCGITVASANCTKCFQQRACSCRMLDGSGIVDLSSLSTKDGAPQFKDILGTDGNLYYFNPCTPISLKATKICTNSSVCMYDTKNNQYRLLGLTKSVKFVSNGANGLTVVYSVEKDGKLIRTEVTLVCCGDTKLMAGGALNTSLYNMTLLSPCACAGGCSSGGGLSPGSMLLIAAASLTLTYMFVGILYKRTVYRSEGLDMVPHVDFCIQLPSLVRDGYWFFISPCVGDRIEYRYYERL